MTRQLNIEYIEIIPNVYIMGVSGKLYKKSQWDNNEQVNGLIIRNDSHSFLFTTEDYKAGTSYMFLGTNPLLSDPATNFLSLDKSSAMTDYDGQGNTERIKYYLENSTEENKVSTNIRWKGTLDFINNETFRDGTKAYIGSCGELNMLIDNFDEVNEILSLLGLPTLNDLPYDMAYTSTMEVNEDEWNVYRLHGGATNLHEGIYSTNCFGLGTIYKYGKYTF